MVRDPSGLYAGMNSCWMTSVVLVLLPFWQTNPTPGRNLPKTEPFLWKVRLNVGRQVDEVAFKLR
jgi:hypothetical protein